MAAAPAMASSRGDGPVTARVSSSVALPVSVVQDLRTTTETSTRRILELMSSRAICDAARCEDLRVVLDMLARRSRDNDHRCVASGDLTAAAYNSNWRSVVFVLADGADPAAWESRALRKAAMLGHEDIVYVLLADGRADPSALKSEALRYAVARRNVAIVRALLMDGRADPAVVRHDGEWPLAWRLAVKDTRWRRRRAWLRSNVGAGGVVVPE